MGIKFAFKHSGVLQTDLPPGSNMQRLAYADYGSACKLAGGSNHSTAHVGESNSRSNVFQIRRSSVCVPSRWKVLSGEFRRRPTSLAIKSRKPDRVGRRGLSEPREDFSRLNTYVFPWLYPGLDSVAHLFAYPAAGKFSRASSACGLAPHVHYKEGREHCHSQHESRDRLL